MCGTGGVCGARLEALGLQQVMALNTKALEAAATGLHLEYTAYQATQFAPHILLTMSD